MPRGAPAGYELDSVYGLDTAQLDEEFRAYNAPSGGVVAGPRHRERGVLWAEIETLPVIHRLADISDPVDTLTLYVGPRLLEPQADAIVALCRGGESK